MVVMRTDDGGAESMLDPDEIEAFEHADVVARQAGQQAPPAHRGQ